MKKIKIIPETIQENFNTTMGLIPEDFKEMFGAFADKYSLCPASSRADYFAAFPGGLCLHTLNVYNWTRRFKVAMEADVDTESLKKIVFLHNFGKVGSLEEDYFVEQESKWHRDRGMLYELNPKLTYMKIPQRSLFLAQEFGIKLTEDEYLAVLLQDGHVDDTNAPYKFREPNLALVFQNSVQWARRTDKKLVASL